MVICNSNRLIDTDSLRYVLFAFQGIAESLLSATNLGHSSI